MNQFISNFVSIYSEAQKNNFFYFTIIFFLISVIPILFKRMNLPFVFGFILFGMVLGPHGLALIERTPVIEFFSKIGLLYIMFLAGLELDFREFQKNKHKSIVFGSLTFWVPLFIAFFLCYKILHFDFLASLMVSIMFSTHTLLAYPIVSKYNLVKREEVAITVGGTIITDTLVLLLFIFIVNHSKGKLDYEFTLQFLLIFAIFYMIMFYLIPKISSWFFQKIESEKYIQLAYVFSVIFFSVYLAEISYLEPIIGAFAAGLALNRMIPNTSLLMQRIDLIGNAIFIPIFMIFVGMVIDVNLLFKDIQTLKIALILSFGAILSKGVASYILKLFYPFNWKQVNLIFGLSSAHAAATLAVILVGYELNLVDEYILNGTIILIMFTSLFSSLLTEHTSKKILLEEEKEIEKIKELDTQETILIPVVNLETMHRLIELSLLMVPPNSSNSLNILTVVPNDELAESNILNTKSKIENFLMNNSPESINKFNIITAIDQNPVSGIAIKAKEIMAEMVVLGWPSRTNILEKFFAGEKLQNMIHTIYKNIFICNLENPITWNHRIMFFLGEYSEKEPGFEFVFRKITLLCKKLSIPMYILCNQNTQNAVQEFLKNFKNKIEIHFISFLWKDFEDLDLVLNNVRLEDLVIFLCSRKGYVSYINAYDSIFEKLNKYLKNNNKIVIYPQQRILEKVIL
ncbi:MAG: cation:proton antiporter [Leptonema sp. (in: bacteria)]